MILPLVSQDALAGERGVGGSVTVSLTVVDSLSIGDGQRASSGAEVIILTGVDPAVVTYVVLD